MNKSVKKISLCISCVLPNVSHRNTRTNIKCTFIRDFSLMSTSLNQLIHLKLLLNILYHVSRSYLVKSSQIKH